jgi:hypothetical protein
MHSSSQYVPTSLSFLGEKFGLYENHAAYVVHVCVSSGVSECDCRLNF